MPLSAAAQPIAVPVAPLFAALEPYLVAVLGAMITTIGAWVLRQMQIWMDITVDAAMHERLNQSAMNAATQAFAKLEGPVGGLSISISSPLVASGVHYVMTHAAPAIKSLNYTPLQLQELVLAKLGAAQLGASSSCALADPSSVKAGEPKGLHNEREPSSRTEGRSPNQKF